MTSTSSKLAFAQAKNECAKRSFAEFMFRLERFNETKSERTLSLSSDESSASSVGSPVVAGATNAALPRASTNPNLRGLMQAPGEQQPVTKRPCRESLRMVDSEPSLNIFQAKSAQATAYDFPAEKSDAFLRNLLSKRGHPSQTYQYNELSSFFQTIQPEAVETYDLTLVQAVRQDDVATLRHMWKDGRPMQCGNKYGESILHMACRRGSVGVVRFLLFEALVSPKLCCDYGRTPLHDACWISQPNFTIIELLLQSCPDLLHIRDKRNFSPLDYVSVDQHRAWNIFLESQPIRNLVIREIGAQNAP